jgi:Putative beta-barrel porin 2
LATVTGTNYPVRPFNISSQGLSSNITEDQLNLTYTKNFSPNLSVTASYGVVGVRNGSFSLEPASGFEPVYSLLVNWTATPKLGLTASASKAVSPPTSIIANVQVTESANLSLTYSLTPKLLLAAGVQASRASGAFGALTNPSVLNPVFQPFAANSNYYSANASINYTITPFVTANLSYTYTKTVQSNLVTPTNVVLLTLTFAPFCDATPGLTPTTFTGFAYSHPCPVL